MNQINKFLDNHFSKLSNKILLPILILVTIASFVYFKNKPPNIVIWVWERPENLYFMEDENVSFSYLAGTITKTDKGLIPYFRQQPLRIPNNSKTMAVVRIEHRVENKSFSESDRKIITKFIVESCTQLEKNGSCQIDFDATKSQLDFYKKLLTDVRLALPKKMKLSITSLLSWCTTKNAWFDNSPINEVVPMFFRLGTNSNEYWDKIKDNKLELNSACKKSIGISTDENLPKKYLKNKTIYIFNNEYWNYENWSKIKASINEK